MNDVLESCYKLIENKLFYYADEDTRTKQILDLLSNKYNTKDQSRYGTSENGIKSGEVDGVIVSNGIEHFLEAFNLSNLNRNYIKKHIHKLEKHYDSKGIKQKFSLIYLNTNNFENLFKKTHKYLTTDLDYLYEINSFDEIETKYTNIRALKTVHLREGKEVFIYHIIMKFPENIKTQ